MAASPHPATPPWASPPPATPPRTPGSNSGSLTFASPIRSPSPVPTAAEVDALPIVSTHTTTHTTRAAGRTPCIITATACVRTGFVASVTATARVAGVPSAALVGALLDAGPLPGTECVLRRRTIRDDGGRSVAEVDGVGAAAFATNARSRTLVTAHVGAGVVAFSLTAQGALRSAEGWWSAQGLAAQAAPGDRPAASILALSLTLVPSLGPHAPHDALLAPLLARHAIVHVVRIVAEASRFGEAGAASSGKWSEGGGAVTPRAVALPPPPTPWTLFPDGVVPLYVTAVSLYLTTREALTTPHALSWLVARAQDAVSTSAGAPLPSPLLHRVALRTHPATARTVLRSHPVARRPRRTATGDAAWHVPTRETARLAAARAWARLAMLLCIMSVCVAGIVLARRFVHPPALESVFWRAARPTTPSVWWRSLRSPPKPPPPPPPPMPPSLSVVLGRAQATITKAATAASTKLRSVDGATFTALTSTLRSASAHAHSALDTASALARSASTSLSSCPITQRVAAVTIDALRSVDAAHASLSRRLAVLRPAGAPPARHWFCKG